MSVSTKNEKKQIIKGASQDKDKDKTKRKNDSPDPSQSPFPCEVDEARQLDGSDIQALAIKEEDLQKLKEARHKHEAEHIEAILVKKKAKNVFPTVEVHVAKLVPNKPLKPIDLANNAGIKVNNNGDFIPYSILGNFDDYFQELRSRGELPEYTNSTSEIFNDELTTGVYDKGSAKRKDNAMDPGSKALVNWQNKMIQRKKTQGFISKLLSRSPDELVMNQSDKARRNHEIKTLIDRTLPLVEYGKGRRFNSEFWNQPLKLGDVDHGLFMSLNATDKGNLPVIEHITKPNLALQETELTNKKPSTVHYPWEKSKFLKQRLTQLDPYIRELVPHVPEFTQLEIIGQSRKKSYVGDQKPHNMEAWQNPDLLNTNNQFATENPYENINTLNREDSLADYPDVVPDIVFCPSIMFGGQIARWTGGGMENGGIVALENRLNFETKAGKRVLATFEIVNCGSTVIYYDWRKTPYANPFDIVNSNTQRFYFDTRSGILVPGDLLKLNFVFKSEKGGVFTEKWEFLTRPKMLSGACLILTLRGIAIQEDKYRKIRVDIEDKLLSKQSELIATEILDSILAGVRTPERPHTPEDAYITDEEVFTRLNPTLNFDQELIDELRDIYMELNDNDQQDSESLIPQWDLSIWSLQEKILSLSETNEQKQSYLQKFNTAVNGMTFQKNVPCESKFYNACYNLLCQSIDDIVDEIYAIKVNMRMNVNTDESYPAVDKIGQDFEDWKQEFVIYQQMESEKKIRQEKEKGKDKSKKTTMSIDKKEMLKKEADKKKPTQSPGMAANKPKQNTSKTPTQVHDKLEDKTVNVLKTVDEHSATKKLFFDKANLNVYEYLVKMFDKMDLLFADLITDTDTNKKLAAMINSKFTPPKFSDYI